MNPLATAAVTFLVPAQLDACCIIRARVNEVALKLPFTNEELDEIKIAVGEAASNAVRHGCKDRPWALIGVRCWIGDDELGIEISDDGPGFDLSKVNDPDFFALPEGGMGIFCMRQVMDRISYTFNEGTTVTLIKRLKPVPTHTTTPHIPH